MQNIFLRGELVEESNDNTSGKMQLTLSKPLPVGKLSSFGFVLKVLFGSPSVQQVSRLCSSFIETSDREMSITLVVLKSLNGNCPSLSLTENSINH